MIRPPPPMPRKATAELKKAYMDFDALQKLWIEYQQPCAKEDCKSKDTGKQGKEDNEDDANDDGRDREGDGRDEDDSENEDSAEEEEEESTSHDRKSLKSACKKQANNTYTKKSHKKLQHPRRGWMITTPYIESIPYSHRYGYTWANTTSNELMEIWQMYQKPVAEQHSINE
jgi:cobalamin biosynthesis protein CobT